MLAIKTIRIAGYTSKSGYAQVDSVLLLLKTLYNGALEERRTAYKQEKTQISRNTQGLQLKDICKDIPEYAALDRHLLQSTLRRLDKAFQGFFRRVKAGQKPGYPRWQKASRFKSITDLPITHCPAWYHFDGQKVVITVKGLPAITAWVDKLDVPEGLPKTLGVIRKGRRIWLTLTYEFVPDLLPFTGGVIGLDRGVKKALADSNGETVAPFKRDWKKRKRLQRKMSRRKPQPGVRGSGRYRKASVAHARLLEKESGQQKQRLHRVTSRIVRESDIIVVEDLKIRNMTRTAKGTTEAPGKRVAAKSGLNRSILEQGWGEILRQLTYKAEWAGKQLVAVDPRYTSQTCHQCSNVKGADRRGEWFSCSSCGWVGDADHNAAVNILRRGLASLGLNRCPTGAQDVAITLSGEVGYQLMLALESPG